ncbi:zincin-like metallopeptidase domain-containing protein [Burkholderia vietnamiensis]|uniref:zincin-like metallopeptidase domain-containing protein n=1 Tax=Burkholderia vietnamiensis TaxID=60552 RepID=UPI001CF32BD8|nr:zincin-like metallopeptidase domain-containing protein [Burkholderia vietnamiensis]MCA8270363.1 DUF5710 domain-containing protein [Burkholderia vietnamiensis]
MDKIGDQFVYAIPRATIDDLLRLIHDAGSTLQQDPTDRGGDAGRWDDVSRQRVEKMLGRAYSEVMGGDLERAEELLMECNELEASQSGVAGGKFEAARAAIERVTAENGLQPTYLRVPFDERHQAMSIGAKIDPEKRQFYVPSALKLEPFRVWMEADRDRGVSAVKQDHYQDVTDRYEYAIPKATIDSLLQLVRDAGSTLQQDPTDRGGDAGRWDDVSRQRVEKMLGRAYSEVMGGDLERAEELLMECNELEASQSGVAGGKFETARAAIERVTTENALQPTYLHVPFDERHQAASLGAKIDPEKKQFYVPSALKVEPFGAWLEPDRDRGVPPGVQDHYQDVTDRLIAALERGAAPWQVARDNRIERLPYNAATGKPFAGPNSLYLSLVQAANGFDDPRWVTYKEAKDLGWPVTAGQKGVGLTKWIFREGDVELDRPKLTTVTVFHVSQLARVPQLDRVPREFDVSPLERAKEILQASGARILHDQAERAYYSPVADEIHMPRRDRFPTPEAYYGAALQQLAHWSGHESRLDREQGNSLASTEYAKEVLRAELASYFLGDQLGVQHDPARNAAYSKAWIQVLREDKGEIFRAAADAQKIVDYVQGLGRSIERDASLEQATGRMLGHAAAAERVQPATLVAGGTDAPATAHDNNVLDRWHPASFEVKGIRFGSVGHYMAFSKAKVFGDDEMAGRILAALDRDEQRALGRQVKGFVEETWLARREAIAVPGERAKFLQNPALRAVLMEAPHESLNPVLVRVREQVDGLEKERAGAPATPALDVKAVRAARRGTEPEQGDTILAVPYSERRKAAELGAVWAPKAEVWFAPKEIDPAPLAKWTRSAERGPARSALQTEYEARDQFRKALVEFGFELDGLRDGKSHPVMDGQIHRVPLRDGKRGRLDGAYVGHVDGIKPAGWMHNHTTGVKTTWSGKGLALPPEEVARMAAEQALAKQQRQAAEDAKHIDAARRMGARWGYLKKEPTPGKSTYLDRKQVPGVGVKFDGDKVVIPLRDVNGKIWSLQTILPEKISLEPGGEPMDKLLAKGAKKEGHMHVLGEIKPGEPVVVLEGYATAASVHLATGYTTVAAIDSGNLTHVVGALREKHPTNPMFIGADDDRFPNQKTGKIHNAGLLAAIDASVEHGVGVLVPNFTSTEKLTDFNDLHVHEGLGEVKRQIEEGIALSVDQSRMRAQEIVRQQLGQDAEVRSPGPDTRHTGEVLGVTRHHVAQSVGADTGMVHETSRLNARPVAGNVATIQYTNGRGVVNDRTREKALKRTTDIER